MNAETRQYGRDDVTYDSWYTAWMKRLALTKTRGELECLLGVKHMEADRAARAHLRAIDATGSMTGQSQRRAQMGNVTAAAGDYRIALNGAIEIYELFPEYTRENT